MKKKEPPPPKALPTPEPERLSLEARKAIDLERMSRRREVKASKKKGLPIIEDASKGAPPYWPRNFAHLWTCFGQGPMRPTHCECPPACRRLCETYVFHPGRCPRSNSPFQVERPYAPIPSAMLTDWGPHFRVSAAAKLTYLLLVSKLRADVRWILYHPEKLAAELGVSVRVFNQHAREIEARGLIVRRPVRDLARFESGSHSAILMLDLPIGFPGWDQYLSHTSETESEPEDA